MNKCCIVGAGEIESLRICENDYSYIIAADGGLDSLRENHIVPNMVIGDFDSSANFKTATEEIINLPKEKDDTDLLAAIRVGLQKGFRNFDIYGCLFGTRIDHTFASLQCLSFLLNNGAVGKLFYPNSKGYVFLAEGPSETKLYEKHAYISILAFSEMVHGVTLEGFKYPLTDYIMSSSFPIGISNELVGQEGKISIRSGRVIICVHKF